LKLLPEIKTPIPGPRSIELAKRLMEVECPAFEARRDARERASGASQSPIVYARGEGSNVWDVDGNRYVDLTAGFGALLLGHRPPEVIAAAGAQMGDLVLALGDVYASDVKVELCEKLAQLFPEQGARVMLGSSGADAITAALKTAMLHTGRPRVVAFEGSYHGLSYAPLAACGLNRAFREPFAAQLGDHVTFVPYGTVPDLKDAGAVLVEPILGRGGCIVPPADFLPALRRACDASGALLIADEIWTGLGRSGSMITTSVVPDIVCLGKGLGGGFPISACIGRAKVMQAWAAHGGSTIHTATHFGWPVACRAALATLEVLERRSLAQHAARSGERLRAMLGGMARGAGLMVGIALDDPAHALRTSRRLLERGWIVLTGGRDGATLTLTPPLDIDESLLAAFAEALRDAL
jgi:4-aminobutyrate aminotransferase/(S)-3-amino-2-methylpropionate transaminase